ncbi:MAG: hypothetical protein JWM96_618 [Alphaproteobacteria bacterium]|nr:hypothetical protein [Alphaproteobacteria bacterium]
MALGREIIFEFHRIGPYVKVTAMDTATQEETSITGAANAPKEYLEKLARDKLFLVLRNKGLLD